MGNSLMITAKCPMCNGEHYMEVAEEDAVKVKAYYNGVGLIQDILPNFNAFEREFIKTGYCPGCQRLLFGAAIPRNISIKKCSHK